MDIVPQGRRRIRVPQVAARPLDLARPPDRLAREAVAQSVREARPSDRFQRHAAQAVRHVLPPQGFPAARLEEVLLPPVRGADLFEKLARDADLALLVSLPREPH